MLSVNEAFKQVMNQCAALPLEYKSINTPSSVIIRENLFADRDIPPFDRVAMDGVAIAHKDLLSGRKIFKIVGMQKAGEAQKELKSRDSCLEVMTGSVLPLGTDCVIPYEQIRISENICTILTATADLKCLQNIHRRGSDTNFNHKIVEAKSDVSSPVWAISAAIGKDQILASKQPRINVVSTGDELVAINEKPNDYQIRRSNLYAIHASLIQNGFEDINLHHLPDNKKVIYNQLCDLISKSDCLIISGGVSAGKYDFIPSVLKDVGIEPVFHKIKQKPGKPLWFGLGENGQQVFGLPGNPVSTLVTLYRYTIPALKKRIGSVNKKGQLYTKISSKLKSKSGFTLFLPVKLRYNFDASISADLVNGKGSGNYISLAESDGFIEVSDNGGYHHVDSCHPVYLWK